MTQNDVATCQQIDTNLTRERSRVVRAGLLVQRRLFGALSPAGHRCSNLDELLQNREKATGDQLRNIDRSIAVQARELAALSNQHGEFANTSSSDPKGDCK